MVRHHGRGVLGGRPGQGSRVGVARPADDGRDWPHRGARRPRPSSACARAERTAGPVADARATGALAIIDLTGGARRSRCRSPGASRPGSRSTARSYNFQTLRPPARGPRGPRIPSPTPTHGSPACKATRSGARGSSIGSRACSRWRSGTARGASCFIAGRDRPRHQARSTSTRNEHGLPVRIRDSIAGSRVRHGAAPGSTGWALDEFLALSVGGRRRAPLVEGVRMNRARPRD